MTFWALLHFTEFGLYLEIGPFGKKRLFSEGPAADANDSVSADIEIIDMFCSYSERTLTYPVDVLRAFSGILTTLYGQRASFGMPWDIFSKALLWSAVSLDREPLGSTETSYLGQQFQWLLAKIFKIATNP
jgi:hypothetical protein